jgi:hypothetical protein
MDPKSNIHMKIFKMQNKIKRSLVPAILFIVPLLFLTSGDSCNCSEDSLDGIKAFKPDNKYFKSSLGDINQD